MLNMVPNYCKYVLSLKISQILSALDSSRVHTTLLVMVIYGYRRIIHILLYLIHYLIGSFWLMITYEAGLTTLKISERVRGQNTGYESQGSKINMVILINFYGL